MLGTRVGVAAADMVAEGKFGQMAALRGNDVIPVPLEEATGELKTVTKQWMELAQVFSK
jgi:6-phosphofructokinase 1